jgi:hypothetical protein
VDELSSVETTEALIAEAADLAEDETLLGHDAVHLAALTIESDVVTSADVALRDAAARQGLHVANPLDH